MVQYLTGVIIKSGFNYSSDLVMTFTKAFLDHNTTSRVVWCHARINNDVRIILVLINQILNLILVIQMMMIVCIARKLFKWAHQ